MALIIVYTEYSLPRPPRLSLGFIERVLGQVSIHLSVDFFYMKRYCVMERDTGFEPAPPAWKAGMLAADTNPANGRGNPGITPEKIGTLKKGEKISSFPVYIIPKNF